MLRRLTRSGKAGVVIVAALGFAGGEVPQSALPATHVETPELRSGYQLSVVDIPPMPDFGAGDTPERDKCPVEVRAIVYGDAASAFAIVALGEATALLKRGKGTRLDGRWVALSEITRESITVRMGDAAFSCALDESAR